MDATIAQYIHMQVGHNCCEEALDINVESMILRWRIRSATMRTRTKTMCKCIPNWTYDFYILVTITCAGSWNGLG